MAKPKSVKAQEPQQKNIQAVYFRMDRISTYAWQPYRLTIFTDGTMIEDIPFKADLTHITLRKMGDEMKESGGEYYERIKADELKKDRAAEEKARQRIRDEQAKNA